MKIKDIINPKTIAGAALLIVVLAIGIMAIIFTLFLAYNMQKQNKEAIKKTEQRYTRFYKRIISTDVNNVYNFIRDKRSNTEKKVKASVKDHVLNTFSIANHIHSINKDVNQSQLMLEIKEALRPIHWGNKEFLFIINNNGSFVLNTDKPELETLISTDLIQLNDNMKMVQIAGTQDSGFFKYKEKNSENSLANSFKIVFVKKFKPFNWTIGAGIYLSDTERNIKNEVLNRVADMDNGEDQYIFIIQDNGFCLYHPLEEFNRKLILDYTAKDGKKVIANLIDTAKNHKNNGYYYYSWKKPSSGKIIPKMSFVKHVKDWDWTIGTGVYLEEMEEAIDI
ncbi:MAG: cache domain-containing protein, partial [Desulfobacteraceae bacterium]|nr:cache domain-containing protein [Desulfobacteraceae bacterium]